MNNNWEIKTIGELCDLATGGTPSRVRKEYFDGGQIKWLVSGDIHQKEIYDCEGRITESGYTNSNAKYLPINSVLIALNGQGKTRGTVALLRVNATCNQSLVSIHPKDLSVLLPEYLCRVLDGRYNEIRKMTGDAGNERRGLNMPLIRSIKIALPPLAEQKRIVKILDEKFGAIEELRKVTEQQIADARELFKSRLNEVYSSPDYNFGDLGDSVQIKTGKLNSNAAVVGGEYPFFTCSREASQIDSYSFDCDAVLLAGNNASADFNVKHFKGKFDAYQRTYVITVLDEKELDIKFVYNLLTHGLAKLKESAVGAGTKFLKIGMIQTFQLPQLSLKEQRQIVKELDDLSEKTKELEMIFRSKVTDLEELKKTYLEQAFSGNL